jgi:hypothetical protein
VYATLSGISPVKWALAGGSSTSGTIYADTNQFILQGATTTGYGGIIKENGNTSNIFMLAASTTTGFITGRIIPIDSF